MWKIRPMNLFVRIQRDIGKQSKSHLTMKLFRMKNFFIFFGVKLIQLIQVDNFSTAENPTETAIYYHTAGTKGLAEKSKSELKHRANSISQLQQKYLPAKPFYQAEEGHQNYYMKNPSAL